jgi:hypothetical protein
MYRKFTKFKSTIPPISTNTAFIEHKRVTTDYIPMGIQAPWTSARHNTDIK